MLRLSFLCVLLFCALAAGAAERRIALVVGNAAYPSSPLKNPANDARAVGQALQRLGFEVSAYTNLGQKEFNRAITRFGERLGPDVMALFYYAGHGIQVRGKNYLVPVDAQIASEGAVRSETVDVDAVLDQFQASGSTLNIVILDACRNNPFERSFRGASGGLAQMDAPKGTLIAYATAPGRVALDGEGDNGLYTTELLKAVGVPGLKVEEVFKRVRVHVARSAGDQQMPWESSSLTGDFYFAGRPAAESEPAAVAIAAQPNAAGDQRAAEGALHGVIGMDNEAFLTDPRVVARLKALGIDLRFQVAASGDVAARLDTKSHGFAFVTGAALAADIARRAAARRSFTPFHTPLAVASWQPVAAALTQSGAATRAENGAWYVDMRRLAEWIQQGRRWKALAGAEHFPSNVPLRVHTGDPRKSSTAAAYLALNAFIANGEIEPAGDEDVVRALPGIRPLFARQGMQETSSVDALNDYLELGMGARPLVLVNEAQYVGRFLRGEVPSAEPVLLYPRPGIFVKHVWVALSEVAERAGRLLREDAELQRLASEHGFRTGRDAAVLKHWREKGIAVPEEFIEMVNPPVFEVLERLIEGTLARPAP